MLKNDYSINKQKQYEMRLLFIVKQQRNKTKIYKKINKNYQKKEKKKVSFIVTIY